MEDRLVAIAAFLRTYLTPERFCDLGESWFWALFEDTRNRIALGEEELEPVLLEALAHWRSWRLHLGKSKGLAFPRRKGNPPSCEAHAVHMVAVWLAGLLVLPDLDPPDPPLRAPEIALLAQTALAERWGGSGAWATITAPRNVHTLLARNRRRKDLAFHRSPEDLDALLSSLFRRP